MQVTKHLQNLVAKIALLAAIAVMSACTNLAVATPSTTPPPLTHSSKCFDDAALSQLIDGASGANTWLLYVWSPSMVMSAIHSDMALQASYRTGVQMLALHDNTESETTIHASQQRLAQLNPAAARTLQNSQPLCAASLLQRDAYRHFPTSFVIADHLIHPHAIIGVMPENYWQLSIRERIADLRTHRIQGWQPQQGAMPTTPPPH